MNYANIEEYLSRERLNRYLRASHNSKPKALILYRTNIRLSQAFYPILNLFETFLRNAIFNQVAMYFEDKEWMINQKNTFMSDPSLGGTRYFLRSEIERAERLIKKRSNKISSAKIVAEQNLGFWTSLFDPHHFRLIGGSAITSFPYKPTLVNRKTIASMLKEIREFRNRVYHNEPICFKANDTDFSKAIQIRTHIIELTKWMNPKLLKTLKYYDNILKKIPLTNPTPAPQ